MKRFSYDVLTIAAGTFMAAILIGLVAPDRLPANMTPNWFADGENILKLAGGTVVVGFQALNLWRSMRNAHNIETLRATVVNHDEEIMAELETARKSLNRIAGYVGPDRRKGPTFAIGGRRADDPPAP